MTVLVVMVAAMVPGVLRAGARTATPACGSTGARSRCPAGACRRAGRRLVIAHRGGGTVVLSKDARYITGARE